MMIAPPKLCVLGSVNLDLIIQTERLPKAGETVSQGTYTALPGGKGANVALAAKRLGAEVELRAAVGNDYYATQALTYLKEAGVNLDALIRLEGSHTGLAFINVAANGENQIAVASGANAAFTPDRLAPVTSHGIVTQFEIPIDTIEAALRGYKGFVSINASPVVEGLERLTGRANLIIVNEGEYDAYKHVLENYEGLLAVTLGSEGAKILKGGDTIAEARPPKVEVIDTTGAGDAFAAALTVTLMTGLKPEPALKFACAVGALTTTKLGTQSAVPFREDVERVLGR